MSVRIRLSRRGRLHRPYYRIVAIDKRCHREGVANEVLGVYDPIRTDKTVEIQMDRVNAWIAQGAQLSTTVASLLKQQGYELPAAVVKAAKKKRKTPKGDGKTWVKPSRRALRQHAAKVKATRKTEREAALAAHKAAKESAEPAAPAAE